MFQPEIGLAPPHPSVFRSSQLSLGVFTTMTSADFPEALTPGISLGQCWFFPLAPSGSTEFSLMTVGLCVCSPARPLFLPHCLFVFLQSRVCLRLFRLVPCGSALAVRLRLSSSTPSGTFILIDPAPARHTSADFSPQEGAHRSKVVKSENREPRRVRDSVSARTSAEFRPRYLTKANARSR